MDWIKIPIDNILYSEFTNLETFTLIRYQALYCQLEIVPNDYQLKRIFSRKERMFLRSNAEVTHELVKNQVRKVIQKRSREKESYNTKQSLSEKSVGRPKADRTQNIAADKTRLDKIRLDKNINKEIWNDFLTLRKAKKAPVTKTVLNKIEKEAAKINWSVEQAMSEMCARGWQGFNSEWVLKEQKGKVNGQSRKERLDNATQRGIEKAMAMEGFTNCEPLEPELLDVQCIRQITGGN